MSSAKPRKGEGRIAFLAHWEKFKELLESGYPMKTIYEDHKEILGLSYSQFTRYVAQFTDAEEHQKGEEVANQSSISTTTQNSQQAKEQPRPDPKKGFSHDPNSGNARDDLI